jgi:ketosteroid isomerase-like protein
MRTRLLIPAALLLCGCGLHHRPVAPEPARSPARDSLFVVDEARNDTVASRGPVEGMLALMDPDVVYLRAGIPAVYGRDGVRAAIAHDAGDGAGNSIVWQPLGGGVSDDLASGYTFGVAARASAKRAPLPVRFERYIAFWRRGPAQPWRITAYAEVNGPTTGEAALPALATSPSVPILPKPLDEARTKVREADSLFADLAYRMGVGYAFSNTVAANGILFGTPALVIGPDAVREFYQSRGETSLAWKPVFAGVAGSGDLGFTVGESIRTVRGPSGAAVQRFGKYLTVWKRQKDGSWKFLVDGGNGSPSPEARR